MKGYRPFQDSLGLRPLFAGGFSKSFIFYLYYTMKPQHILMLKKVGKGMRVFEKGQMRTHEVREGERPSPSIEKLTKDMEGMGMKKATLKSVDPPKRKPLKFKL